VQAPETTLDRITRLFFAEHVFGPGRAALLAAQLPATDAAAAADRDTQTAALAARLKRITTGQDSCILELEELPADPADTASAAMRSRIRARFTELHSEREQVETQLAALAEVVPQAADLTMLEELPMPGDIVPGLPPDLKARLFAAFDLHILWNKPGRQATVHAEITDATLRALPALLDPSRDGYDDTAGGDPEDTGPVEHLFDPPIRGFISHNDESRPLRASVVSCVAHGTSPRAARRLLATADRKRSGFPPCGGTAPLPEPHSQSSRPPRRLSGRSQRDQ
jgi:hypothetical protein